MKPSFLSFSKASISVWPRKLYLLSIGNFLQITDANKVALSTEECALKIIKVRLNLSIVSN